MKRIIVSVTNDLEGDNRVHRVCLTLTRMGFSVLLIGRKLKTSSPVFLRPYTTHRMRLLFNKGALFYAEFNIRLLLFLLLHPFELLLSNDLDTLPANRIAGKIKRKPVVYDSHEYFTEVPELVDRPQIKKIWEWLEKTFVPGVDAAYTVCQSIAGIYSQKYGIPFEVVRNLPLSLLSEESIEIIHPTLITGKPYEDQPALNRADSPADNHFGKEADLCPEKRVSPLIVPESGQPVIIYQGALNKGRGLEQAIRAMRLLPEVTLLIAGSGDLENELRKLASGLKSENVKFLGRVPPEKLVHITRQAWLGISIEEDLGLNYRFALPNKLFDYIQARIPVVVSDLPEMSRVVLQYDIGKVTPSLQPEVLADTFRKALTDISLRNKWGKNLQTAASELTWENEEPKIIRIFEQFPD